MAKKQTTKPAPAAEKTTTYSTRLNDEQRESLERASQQAGVSASRFMRDATLRAAADLENSVSPNDRAMTHLAGRLAETLLNPKVDFRYDDEADQSHERTALGNAEWCSPPVVDSSIVPDEQCPVSAFRVHGLSPSEIAQLTEMARLCPITFSRTLISALTGVREPAPKFVARSDPDRLLND
jgi:uncharacterized protein (DUF1778 family)